MAFVYFPLPSLYPFICSHHINAYCGAMHHIEETFCLKIVLLHYGRYPERLQRYTFLFIFPRKTTLKFLFIYFSYQFDWRKSISVLINSLIVVEYKIKSRLDIAESHRHIDVVLAKTCHCITCAIFREMFPLREIPIVGIKIVGTFSES